MGNTGSEIETPQGLTTGGESPFNYTERLSNVADPQTVLKVRLNLG